MLLAFPLEVPRELAAQETTVPGKLNVLCKPVDEAANYLIENYGKPILTALGSGGQYYLMIFSTNKKWVIARFNVDGMACIIAEGPGSITGGEDGEELHRSPRDNSGY